MNRTDRLLGYLTMLQGRSLITARQMADYFEISERTVYRDIQALCEVGVPIASMPGEGYRLMSGYHLPPIAFTPENLIILAPPLPSGPVRATSRCERRTYLRCRMSCCPALPPQALALPHGATDQNPVALRSPATAGRAPTDLEPLPL